MSTFDIIQAAIIFGSGVMFAGPAAALLTYAHIQDKVAREELLRHQREQHEQATLKALEVAAKTPLQLGVEKVPAAQQRVVPVTSPAVGYARGSVSLSSRPDPHQRFDFTRVDHVPALQTGKHAMPTRSPLVATTMSLTAGSGGWSVTGKRQVTDTDLISLKAIARGLRGSDDGEGVEVPGAGVSSFPDGVRVV